MTSRASPLITYHSISPLTSPATLSLVSSPSNSPTKKVPKISFPATASSPSSTPRSPTSGCPLRPALPLSKPLVSPTTTLQTFTLSPTLNTTPSNRRMHPSVFSLVTMSRAGKPSTSPYPTPALIYNSRNTTPALIRRRNTSRYGAPQTTASIPLAALFSKKRT